jgi:RNA-directed DNA polymerase
MGLSQGGVLPPPVLSNLYLNDVDRMLERAQDATRRGAYTYVEYARFADDLVILVDAYAQHDWLHKAATRGTGQTSRRRKRREESIR